MRPAPDPSSLASWFALLHPRYRGSLGRLALIGLLTAAVVYGENSTLQAFTSSFSTHNADPSMAATATRATLSLARWRDAPPLLLLIAFVVVRLFRLAGDLTQKVISGRLISRARGDLEAEVLTHLLRKDDLFFATRPPGEILNRLTSDLARVADRRVVTNQLVQSALMIAANLAFFLQRDWRLAVAGAITCGLGGWWMHRMTRPVKELDRTLLAKDDRVKSHFEELLRATPEVQVGNLTQKVRRQFDRVQGERRVVSLLYVRLNAVLGVVMGSSYLLSLVSLCLVTLYFFTTREAPAAGVALIPVILKALPELFNNAGSLISTGLTLQLAETSCKRIQEYDSVPAGAADPIGRSDDGDGDGTIDGAIELDGVTYQYPNPSGVLQGGVLGVTATLAPGRWVAVVGGAGSGKSTLTQLLLGRLQPQDGALRFGSRSLPALGTEARARLLSLMPQTVLILDRSILDNLVFGRPDDDVAITPDDLEVTERSGLATVCRTKALDLRPTAAELESPFAEKVRALREGVRASLRGVGLSVNAYEAGGSDRRHWVIEALLRGCGDHGKLLQILLGRGGLPSLRQLLATPVGEALVAQAEALVARTGGLLGLASYQLYSKLAAEPLEERVWQLRASCASGLAPAPARRGPARSVDPIDLLRVALSASQLELDEAPLQTLGTAATDEALAPLRAVVGDACRPFVAGRIHPHLTWRENLIFAAVPASNQRAEKLVEQVVMERIASDGLSDSLTRIGLAYQVGRGGARLSGGQRQLITLCRTLLRRTPVVVLDEPTSALDPASRARVAQLLHHWKQGRILITVSHDPEFVKEADDVLVMEGGRLAASGTVAELLSSSPLFRETMKLGTA